MFKRKIKVIPLLGVFWECSLSNKLVVIEREIRVKALVQWGTSLPSVTIVPSAFHPLTHYYL